MSDTIQRSPLVEWAEHMDDFAWHALNYRTAAPQHAEAMWRELEACVQRKIARLTAERDAARADAERYRWLRDTRRLHLGPVVHMGATRARKGMRYILTSASMGGAPEGVETLDEAIDAAIRASEGQ
jgi:hypothetical protein